MLSLTHISSAFATTKKIFGISICLRQWVYVAGFLLLFASEGYGIACPTPPSPMPSLPIHVFYAEDGTGSVIEEDIHAHNKKIRQPLETFLTELAILSDDVAASRNVKARACAINYMKQWADASALLGKRYSAQDAFVRGWALVRLSLIRTKLSPTLPEEATAIALIDAWLQQLASWVMNYHETKRHNATQRNNLYYWAIVGVGITGLVTDNPALWDYARQGFQFASTQIQPDGSLPLEMKRGQRALRYHAFALKPLGLFALLLHQRGELTKEEAQKIQSLHQFVIVTRTKKRLIAERANAPQLPLRYAPWLQWYAIFIPMLNDATPIKHCPDTSKINAVDTNFATSLNILCEEVLLPIATGL
jgi:poly(beta-D-mannuronate) lyase